MKLYFSPGSNSLAAHITLLESGLPFEAERIEPGSNKTASGADFAAINPKADVPALQLDNAQMLTEVPAIVQYVADQVPATHLAPPLGSMERYRVMEWLAFIGTKLCANLTHTTFGVAPSASRRKDLARHLSFIEKTLADRRFLTGTTFTVADAYLFTVLNEAKLHGLTPDKTPALVGLMEEVAQRPAVRTAMTSEGLLSV